MSSALYRVRIVDARAGDVVMRVTAVHPDAGPPPRTATFALQLLVDLWLSMVDGGVESAQRLARREPWGSFFERLRAYVYGAEVFATTADVDALDAAASRQEPLVWRAQSVLSWGQRNGQPFICVRERQDALPFVAERVVDSCVHEPVTNTKRNMPAALLHLRLTAPELTGFVRVGARFESTAFE